MWTASSWRSKQAVLKSLNLWRIRLRYLAWISCKSVNQLDISTANISDVFWRKHWRKMSWITRKLRKSNGIKFKTFFSIYENKGCRVPASVTTNVLWSLTFTQCFGSSAWIFPRSWLTGDSIRLKRTSSQWMSGSVWRRFFRRGSESCTKFYWAQDSGYKSC